jgi:hypothetical protein
MSKSPSGRNRDQGKLTSANLNRRGDQYGITDATKYKQIGFEVKTDSSKIYAPKPSGQYKHNFPNPYGPSSGPRATTVYPNNPLLNNMFSTPEEEMSQRIEGVNPSNPYNVPYLKKNRQIPFGNLPGYELDERGEVASMLSEPYKRAEERREAAEYAKKSCWEKLMECFKSKKSKKNMAGGSIGGAGVTIKDLRDFLDANQDIKNILVNDECPLGPTEQMINNVDNFTDMLENSENRDITIDEIYNQEAGKRRKKTRKAKRRPRKTRKAKRRTKRRN